MFEPDVDDEAAADNIVEFATDDAFISLVLSIMLLWLLYDVRYVFFKFHRCFVFHIRV